MADYIVHNGDRVLIGGVQEEAVIAAGRRRVEACARHHRGWAGVGVYKGGHRRVEQVGGQPREAIEGLC